MSRHTRSLTALRRDAGLRRLRIVNRTLIGAAVACTGLLSDVAANAFAGHKRTVRRPAATERTPAPASHASTRRHAHHHAHRHHALSHPAQAPSSAPAPTTTSAAPAPQPAAPQSAPAPAPAPAPAAPVVSGGS